MGFYLTISKGPRADLAVPIIATSDQRIIGLVAQALAEELASSAPNEPKIALIKRGASLEGGDA